MEQELKQKIRQSSSKEEINRIRKALEKFGKKRYTTKSDKKFTIKKSNITVADSVRNFLSTKSEKCNYKEFEKLWNDENYGPIIASLIYSGCIKEKIPMKALRYVWYTLLGMVDKKKPFYEIYEELAKDTLEYTYCSNSFNFLVDYYEKGLCNCECGSILSFTLSKLFPTSKFPKVFTAIEENHVKVLAISDMGKSFEFETTVYGGKLIKISTLKGIQYAIYSEQVMGIYVIFNSLLMRINKERRQSLFPLLLQKMFLIEEISLKNIGKILKNVDRFFIKTTLDSNAFDMIILNVMIVLLDIPPIVDKRITKGVYANNEQYIRMDFKSIYSNSKPTAVNITERARLHADQIQKIVNSSYRGIF